jgi:hypothetical protein
MPEPLREKTLKVREIERREVFTGQGRKGSLKEERSFQADLSGEKAREVPKAQESIRPPPGLILRDAKGGHGFFGGSKPLRRRSKAGMGLEKSAGAERKRGNTFSITDEEKSFEGRSLRALETEKGLQG